MKKKSLTFLSLTVLSCLSYQATAFAVSTTFTQKILPLDCVFTVVNAGTGELYYVTPKACGVVLPPSQTFPHTVSGNQLSNSTAANLVPFQHQSSPGASISGTQTAGLPPWSPLATALQSPAGTASQTSMGSKAWVPEVAAMSGIILLIGLLIFLF